MRTKLSLKKEVISFLSESEKNKSKGNNQYAYTSISPDCMTDTTNPVSLDACRTIGCVPTIQ